MPYLEKPIVKKYYTISEVAANFGVSKSTIRKWDDEVVKSVGKKIQAKDLEKIRLRYFRSGIFKRRRNKAKNILAIA
jgi:hypothetical protein